MESMKQRIAVITIIISVFILGALIAESVKRSRAAEEPVSERVLEEETVMDAGAERSADVADEPESADMSGDGDSGANADEAPAEDTEPEEPKPVPLPRYDELLQVNPYVAGWLRIDDSVIDDPVVYTPGSQNYFLHRDIDGSNTSKGTLFIAVDWEEGYNNTLIYGHNMKDGTGFGSLQKFAKESYGRSHPVIHFDTLYEEREYELYAAFYSQIDEEELETEDDRDNADRAIAAAAVAKKEEEIRQSREETEAGQEPEGGPEPEPEPVVVKPEELTIADLDLHRDFGGVDIYRQEKDEDNGRFRYYYFTDLSDRDDFEYYAAGVKERSLYDMGIEAEWGDEFLTLSTCSYQVKNGRFVVVGIRKK